MQKTQTHGREAPAPSRPAGRPPLSRRKRAVFVCLLAVGLYVFTEVASFTAYWFVEGRPFSFAAVRHAQAAAESSASPAFLETFVNRGAVVAREVNHPYLGYVLEPRGPAENRSIGFGHEGTVIHQRSGDRFIVVVLGGSVALEFFYQGVEALVRELARSPALRGKRLVLVNCAMQGYKQPQQLMALNYVIALGGEFDAVITIDGFNEVALHAAENHKKGVFPIFPRNWYARAAQVPDTESLRRMGEISLLQSKRADWGRLGALSPLRYSVSWNTWWAVRDRQLERGISRAGLELLAERPRAIEYVASGPSREFAGEEDLYRELASIWERCSLQLHRICESLDAHYFHFLQPNQYVAGTKPMGDEERRIAVRDDNLYRGGAEKGYPLLIRKGMELERRGVHFHDLTRVFAGVREPAYRDACCHLSELGYEILGRAVGARIVEWLDEDREVDPER